MVTALLFVMEALADHDGWPQAAVSEIATGLFAFDAEGHMVTFRRNGVDRLVMIEVVKPLS